MLLRDFVKMHFVMLYWEGNVFTPFQALTPLITGVSYKILDICFELFKKLLQLCKLFFQF